MKAIRKFTPLTLALLCIALAVYQVGRTVISRNWSDPAGKAVSQWDERIQSLRQFLPPDVTRVGYLDNSVMDKKLLADVDEFFLMQYSMAPVILQVGAEQPWIIGNFAKDTKFRPWLNVRMKHYEVQSFGGGIYIIHNLDK